MLALRDLRQLTWALGLYFLVVFIHRMAFWFFFLPDPMEAVGTGQVMASWWLGLRFDLRICCALLLVLLTLFGSLRIAYRLLRVRERWLAPVQMGVMCLSFIGFFIMLWIDFGFYAYNGERLNAMFLDLAADPLVSLGMIAQHYPIGPLLLGFAACQMIIFGALRKFIFWERGRHFAFFSAKRYSAKDALVILSLFLGLGLGFHASATQYLKTAHAYLLKDKFLIQFALNPLHHVIDTYRFKLIDNVQYDGESAEQVRRELGLEGTENKLLARPILPNPLFETPPNIVIIHLECIGAARLGAYGNPLGATPALDALIEDSLLFENAHIPHKGTAQSMFSLLTGIPDIATFQTAFRNPFFIDQNILIDNLSDYKKFFFVGGKGNWKNMQSMMVTNIRGLEFFSDGDFAQPAIDVWGISDLDLLVQAHQKMNSLGQNERFFTFIQTATHHGPYTLYDAEGFKTRPISPQDGKDYSFGHRTYNALRLFDHALGHFFDLAQKANYYPNTLFILYGDHGLHQDKQVNLSEFYTQQGFIYHHVPLIFHSPQLPEQLRGARNSTLGYLPDVLPTAFSMMGVEAINSGFGLDLLSHQALKRRESF